MPVSKEGRKIRRMFADISRRYDFLNHVLSLNIDRIWRRKAVRALELSPKDRILDCCTGTADLALALAKGAETSQGGAVVGTDFCEEMVAIGEVKRAKRGENRVSLMVADTLELPFEDATFDAATVAFGIRNVSDLDRGLREMARVLKPGGRLAILEFTTSKHSWVNKLFGFYFHRILPRVGKWLSGHPSGADAYAYLPASVREFPKAPELAKKLEASGLQTVRFEYLSLGIAALHVGVRSHEKVEHDPSPTVAAPGVGA